MTTRRLAPLLLVLGLAACAGPSAYQQSMTRARKAHAAGDYATAAHHYRDACQRAGKPDDPSCKSAREHTEYIHNTSVAAAAAPCRAGDVAACRDALAPALALTPGAPELTALLDEAGDVYAARCDQQVGARLEDAVRYVRCLESAADAVGTPRYRARVGDARAAAARVFIHFAEQPALAEYPGARYVLWDAAAEYGDAHAATARDDAWRAFVDAAAIPVIAALHARGPGAPAGAVDLCADVRPGDRVACRAGDGAVLVDVELSLGALRHRAWTETRSQQYQAGVRRDPNPAYRAAQRRVARADDAVREIEPQLVDLKVECDAADRAWWDASSEERPAIEEHKQVVCDRYERTKDILDRRMAELRDAEYELERTPAFVEEAIYDTHTWTAVLHEWTASYSYAITVAGSATSGTGEVQFTAEDQPGFAPAGVPARSRGTPPQPADAYARAHADLTARTRAALEPALTARAAARAADCPPDRPAWTAGWLQCRSEVALWSGTRQRAASLLRAVR